MSSRRLVAIWTGLALALAPALAGAQEGLGLDLSSEIGPDLRPSLAVLGVSSEPTDAELADAATAALLAAARKQSGFNPVMPPDQARQTLSDAHAEAGACAEAACLEPLARALGVERLVLGKLTREDKRLKLVLLAFARGQTAVESTELEASGRGGLQRKVKSATPELLEKISAALTLLKVTTNVPTATVALGERELGQGSLEKPVPSGKSVLHVSAPGYAPYESELTLPAGGKQAAEANLTALTPSKTPRAVSTAAVDTRPPSATATGRFAGLWRKPPVYVALAGVAALGVGMGLGAAAQGVANKASPPSPGGVLSVTRAELLAAQQNARWANILMGTGGALAAGGALWFFLTPTPPASREAHGQLQPTGAQLVATGSF